MGTRIPLDPRIIRYKEKQEKLAMSLAEIGLSVRTTNCLDEQGICTVGQLLAREREELLSIPNFGEKTLSEVFAALEKLGFVRKERRKGADGYAPEEAARLAELEKNAANRDA